MNLFRLRLFYVLIVDDDELCVRACVFIFDDIAFVANG